MAPRNLSNSSPVVTSNAVLQEQPSPTFLATIANAVKQVLLAKQASSLPVSNSLVFSLSPVASASLILKLCPQLLLALNFCPFHWSQRPLLLKVGQIQLSPHLCQLSPLQLLCSYLKLEISPTNIQVAMAHTMQESTQVIHKASPALIPSSQLTLPLLGPAASPVTCRLAYPFCCCMQYYLNARFLAIFIKGWRTICCIYCCPCVIKADCFICYYCLFICLIFGGSGGEFRTSRGQLFTHTLGSSRLTPPSFCSHPFAGRAVCLGFTALS